jgi:hypothetical protein
MTSTDTFSAVERNTSSGLRRDQSQAQPQDFWTHREPISRRRGAVVLGLTLLLQFVFQSWFFPLDELLTQKRLVYIDSTYHQYMMETTVAYCRDGRVTGYDPYFQAGFVSGTTFDVSTKAQTVAACLDGRADAVAPLYKIFSFGFGVVGPALLVLGAVLLRLEFGAVAIVALLAIVGWWTGPVRWFHTAGMTSFIAAAYLTVPFAAIATRACLSGKATWVAAAAAVGAIGALIHPLFVVAAAFVATPLIVTELRGKRRWAGAFVVVLVIAAATLALNGFWVLPWLTERRYDIGVASYQRLVDPLLILHEPLRTAETTAGGSRLYLALLIAAVPALLTRGSAHARRMQALALGFLLLMLLASFGGSSDAVAGLQPNRFSVVAWLTLMLPAATGIMILARSAMTARASTRLRVVAATLLFATVAIIGFFVRDASFEIFGHGGARYAVTRPEVKGDGPTTLAIVAALKEHTDRSARVFFETSLGRAIDGAHVAGYLALAADRELVGGPYPFNGFVNAWDNFAFGKRLSDFRVDELVNYLDLYNVRWMFCRTTACREAMAAIPGTRLVTETGPMALMERPMTPSFTINGTGSVDARCLNRLEVTNSGSADLVLKYHWVDGLVARPSARIEPRFVPGVPRPFIAVISPPARFAIGMGEPRSEACATR